MTQLITLDFETYYSKDYGLKKYTTEHYIRDEQFQVIGFAYKVDDGETHWVTGTDRQITEALHEVAIVNHTELPDNRISTISRLLKKHCMIMLEPLLRLLVYVI
jgi:hypothetical protein